MSAKLIAICGPDQVGKETQARLLVKHLRNANYIVAEHEMPAIDCHFGKKIKQMLKDGSAVRNKNLFQFYQFLNKLSYQLGEYSREKNNCDFIVLDRWRASMIAYGDATGVNKLWTRFLHMFLVEPDITVVLHATRSHSGRTEDVFEADNRLQYEVRRNYNFIKDSCQIHVDAMNPIDVVHSSIVKEITNRVCNAEKV